MRSKTRTTITCATCGKVIPHGHVARFTLGLTGANIERIQAHHIRCAGAKGVRKAPNRAVRAIRNVTRNALARIGLTILAGLC